MLRTTPKFNAAIPLAKPTPSTAPTSVWVVEIGSPVPEASTTVQMNHRHFGCKLSSKAATWCEFSNPSQPPPEPEPQRSEQLWPSPCVQVWLIPRRYQSHRSH